MRLINALLEMSRERHKLFRTNSRRITKREDAVRARTNAIKISSRDHVFLYVSCVLVDTRFNGRIPRRRMTKRNEFDFSKRDHAR